MRLVKQCRRHAVAGGGYRWPTTSTCDRVLAHDEGGAIRKLKNALAVRMRQCCPATEGRAPKVTNGRSHRSAIDLVKSSGPAAVPVTASPATPPTGPLVWGRNGNLAPRRPEAL